MEFGKCEAQVRRLIHRANTTGEIDEEVTTQNLKDEWDTTLTKNENLQRVTDFLGELVGTSWKIPSKASLKQEQAEAQAREETQIREHIQAESDKAVAEIKARQNPELQKYYATMTDYVKLVAQGYANTLIILGEGGVGKSWTTQITLKELKADYVTINSFISPMELYKTLYKNADKLIVFDDVEGLFDNDKALSILKSATWGATGLRVVNYISSTDKLENAPSEFIFTGQVIILANSMGNNPNLNALKTRAINYECKFTNIEKLKMFYEFAKIDFEGLSLPERNDVVDYLKEFDIQTIQNLNFRLLLHLFAIRAYAKTNDMAWQGLVFGQLAISNELKRIKELLAQYPTTAEACRVWCQETALSRRSFFYYKAKLALNCT